MASDPPTFSVSAGFLGAGRRGHDAAISVAGIPLDIGTTNRSGARFGPQAIRQASRMLVDGAHPTKWIDVPELMLSDIGDFRIALGDIPASLTAIEEQAAAVDHLVALGGEHGITLPLLRALARRKGSLALVISTPMSIPGRTISVSAMRMVRYMMGGELCFYLCNTRGLSPCSLQPSWYSSLI
jgi:hypothetical protein